ncbi:MAG: DUF4232 domain-containing protein [Actinomycetes bacterium]
MRTPALLAIIGLALGSAACSSTTSSSTTTEPAVSTTSMATTTVPQSTTSTTVTKRTIACTTKTLTISTGMSTGAAGHISVPVVFTNSGSAPCTMNGFPGVAALDASGAQAAQADREPAPGPALLTVAPGSSASALVVGTNVPTGAATSCPTWTALLVTPPGDTAATKVAAQIPGCPGFSVRAVTAGTTGQ